MIEATGGRCARRGWITIDANASTVVVITTAITKAAATGSLLTTNAVAGGDSLNSREVSINAAHPWVGDITKTGLGILVSAGRKSVETEVRREVPIFVLVSKGIDVRLECGNRISIIRELNSA
jgi:hypothetical protein